MMKGAILYFSLTSNTKLACEYIKNKVKNIEFDLYNMRDGYPDLKEYNLVGFATFASEYKVARFVTNFIAGMPEYKNKPAFVFTTYGRDNGAATMVLANCLLEKGFRIVLEHSLNTPENYPPVIRAEHGHVDNPTLEQMAAFDSFIEKLSVIASKLSSGAEVPEYKVTAKMRYVFLSKITNRVMLQSIMGKKLIDTNLCIKCKRCVGACPYGAIKMDIHPVFDESKCHGCFACYNICPKKAIYTKRFNKFGNYPKPIPQLVKKLSVDKE